MKRLGRLGRPMVTTLALGILASPAVAQYTPQAQVYPGAPAPGYYATAPQQATAPPAVSQTQVGVPTYTQAPRQAQAPQYQPAQQPTAQSYPQQGTGYPAAVQANPYASQQGYPQATYPATQAPAPTSPYPRTAMVPYDRYAMQDEPAPPAIPTPPQTPQSVEPLPTPANGQPGAVPGATEGYYPQQTHGYPQGGYPYPAGAPQSYVATGDCNCNGMAGWNAYMAPHGQHAAGCAPCADAGCEVSQCRQWFFGAYALYMQRDNPGYERLAVVPGMPYQTVLSTNDLDNDFAWGAEIRLGCTFGGTPDPCNPCAQRRSYAWEVVYWGLTDDEDSAMYSGMPAPYGTIDYGGLEYDIDGDGMVDGTVNDYFNYLDINNPMPNGFDSTVRVRNSFKAQNLELNFLRLPVYGCEPCSPIVISTVCGVRFLKFDEEFQNSVMFYDGMTEGSLYHDIEVDNQLYGFQLGSNINWAISCKWDVFCDSMMGVYNNRAEVYQRVYGGEGDVTFIDDGMPAAVRSKKDDIAFMGELRWGLGYQVSCNCRLTLAYRVMAVTGVAMAVEQIPGNWSGAQHVAWVDSNDSLILHGLQLGAEFKY